MIATKGDTTLAHRSKSESRAARRREEAGIKLVALGAGFAVVPLFLGASPLGKAFSGLVPIGIVMLVGGGVMLWLMRRPAPVIDRAVRPVGTDAATREAAASPPAPLPADRAVDEFVRASTEAKPASQAPATRPTAWSPGVFAQIEWRRFEGVVEAMFQQAGLETKSQSHGADGGVDVWLYSRQNPEVPVCVVQCKRWAGRQVGVDKIRELLGVMTAKKVGRGFFVTTSTFSKDAAQFANENRIDLLDINGLLAMIGKRSPEQQDALLQVALEGEYWKPTCVNCGIKMVPRKSGKDGSEFWGCSNYPRCNTTMPMRRE